MIKFLKQNFFFKDKSGKDPVVDYVVKMCNAYNKKNFMNTSLYDAEFSVVDTETTGLDVSTAKIINIAAVKIKNFKIIDYYNAFINPGMKINPDSIKWHGISDDMVRDKPHVIEVLPEFMRFIKNSIIVGHHIKFDMDMISKEMFDTYGCSIKQRCLDTMFIYTRGVIKRDDHVSLDFLLDLYKVKCIGRHTALGDAMATAEVFNKMIMQISGEYKKVSELFELQKDNTANM
ncbi:MAG: polymerase epsilon subunit [Deferribacteraceae bacterium]|jgi:DNA polymerase III epsilon subunit family exonuclease|nr:polymerase epsilon subunit [Deferribacteraceae bacterium]